jgi:hypothetical protein
VALARGCALASQAGWPEMEGGAALCRPVRNAPARLQGVAGAAHRARRSRLEFHVITGLRKLCLRGVRQRRTLPPAATLGALLHAAHGTLEELDVRDCSGPAPDVWAAEARRLWGAGLRVLQLRRRRRALKMRSDENEIFLRGGAFCTKRAFLN